VPPPSSAGRLEKSWVRRSAFIGGGMKRFDFVFILAWLFSFLYVLAIIVAEVVK
jgi:hypothetical protein